MNLSRKPVVSVAVALLASVGILFVARAQGVITFLPPRTAVVDIGEVFNRYQKAIDKRAEVESAMQGIRDRLTAMKEKEESLRHEILLLKSGTKSYDEKLIEIKTIELARARVRNNDLGELQESMVEFVSSVRREITGAVRAHAEAMDLDLVLEQTVRAEGRGPVAGFEWPIVHYAKPELDITAEISKRLNEAYRRAGGKGTSN